MTREPWYEDMAIYNAKFSNHEVDGKEEFNDESALDIGQQRQKPPEEANWDSSTWRYVPHSLKGIKPVTNEVPASCAPGVLRRAALLCLFCLSLSLVAVRARLWQRCSAI